MTHFTDLRPLLLVALVLGLGARALFAATSGGPYQGIVTRNVFGLMPAPTTVTVVPPVPLAKVHPVGITTMLNNKIALLKISVPALPPEPAKELSCILSVGQREGPIEVLEIDERAGSVTVSNAGTTQVLTLEKDSPRPQTPFVPPPPMPLPMQAAARR